MAAGCPHPVVSPLELILPPDAATPEAYRLRNSRTFHEWAALIASSRNDHENLARGFTELACWQAWGIRRDRAASDGSIEEARDASARAMNHMRTDSETALNHAELESEMGRFEHAAESLEISTKLRPIGITGRLLYGAVLDVLGRKDELRRLAAETEPLLRFIASDP